MSDRSSPSMRGRHLLYKAGTKKVIDWLLCTAGALRDIAHILDTPQKKSNSTAKARDMLTLARTITPANANAPLAIAELPFNVIEPQQRRCSKRIALFLQILENVHEQLIAIQAPAKCGSTRARSQETKSSAKTLESELNGIFAQLEVEEPSITPPGSAPSPNRRATTLETTNVVLEDGAEDRLLRSGVTAKTFVTCVVTCKTCGNNSHQARSAF
ncbi:hypothetical protein AC579_5449 [Pseudocercospora musae]|uniref:DUF6604 domain-containing protein n=1 Tax=Pseudocercospora musae TaxID=113226 RepID=A0A139HJE8_9PEZI|nr:hypothetical protein AC579_5449 [Pseudocercospora musae]